MKPRAVAASVILAFALATVSARLALAQTPAAPPPPASPPPAAGEDERPKSVFPQLFPQPTGQNGYEELVLAGEAVRENKTLDAAEQSGVTLATKRAALADPAVRRALALIHQGLQKPIRSPRQTFEVSTLFPDMALMRRLARLIAIYQYVALADGRTGDAINALNDGLQIARAVKGDVLIGGLVGRVIDQIVLTRIARHLDQMSARDCDRLLRLARENLTLPDPTPVTLDTERRATLSAINSLRNSSADSWLDDFFGETEDEQPDPLNAAFRALAADPVRLEQVVSAAESRVNTFYDALIAAQRLPPYQRPEVAQLAAGEAQTIPANVEAANARLSGALVDMFLPVVPGAVDRFDQVRVQLQLLGVHAAVRRFRWENDRLPESLSDLRLSAALATDPYTGAPLLYERTGDAAYTLQSAGPPQRDENGKIVPGKRAPILLPAPPRRPAAAP